MFLDFILVAKVTLGFLSLTIFLCLWVAILGPTIYDRIIAVNVISTKVVVMFALVAVIFGEEFFFGIALVYALLLYVVTLAFAKYLGSGRLN